VSSRPPRRLHIAAKFDAFDRVDEGVVPASTSSHVMKNLLQAGIGLFQPLVE
jgi:hypothetical protein